MFGCCEGTPAKSKIQLSGECQELHWLDDLSKSGAIGASNIRLVAVLLWPKRFDVILRQVLYIVSTRARSASCLALSFDDSADPDPKSQPVLVYPKYWTVYLNPLMVYPKVGG